MHKNYFFKNISIIIFLISLSFIINLEFIHADSVESISSNYVKIDINVSQVQADAECIVYKKGNAVYQYQSENNKIQKMKSYIDKVYASVKMAATIKKDGFIYFWGDGGFGEFYKFWNKDYQNPIKFNQKAKSLWLSNGSSAYIIKNDLFINGYCNQPGSEGEWTHIKATKIISGNADKIKDISISQANVFVLYKDGSAFIRGANQDKEVTKSNDIYGYYKKFIKKYKSGIKKVCLGLHNAAVIKENGDLYMWGNNSNGFLCDSNLSKITNSPQKVLSNVKDISMRYGHVLALKTDGSLWAWGSNSCGEINNKINFDIIKNPMRIMGGVKSMVAGNGFSVILKDDGTLYWTGKFFDGLYN